MLLPDQERTPSPEPRRLASLGSLLDDQHWHHVVMVWRSSHLNLTVDKHTETVQVPAEFGRRSTLEVGFPLRLQMNLANVDPKCLFRFCQLNVGVIQESGKPNRSFRGCLENLLYNNLNLIDLAKRRAQQASVLVSTL